MKPRILMFSALFEEQQVELNLHGLDSGQAVLKVFKVDGNVRQWTLQGQVVDDPDAFVRRVLDQPEAVLLELVL